MENISKLQRIKYLINLQRTEKFKHTANVRSFIYGLILKIVVIAIIAFAISFLLNYFKNLGGLEITTSMLALFLAIYIIFSLISAISSINSFMYKASDNEFLFALPVANDEVYLSKFLIVLFQEFLNSITLFLPILIGFGNSIRNVSIIHSMPFKIDYIIASILLIVFLPILIVGLAMFISVAFRYVLNLIRKSNIALIIYYFLILIALILIFNVIINLVIVNINMFDQYFYLVSKIQAYVYNFDKATYVFGAIAQIFVGNYIPFIIIVALGGVLVVSAYFAIRPFYFKMVLSPPKRVMHSKKKKQFKENKPIKSYIKKEIALLLNGEFFNYFLMIVISPFLLLLVNKLFNALSVSLKGTNLIIGANFMMLGILMLINCAYVANSISSEGGNLYINKTSPISFKKFAWTKILINFSIVSLVLIVCSTISAITLKMNFINFLILTISTMSLLFGHLCYSYLLELKSPILDWHDASELKNNKNMAKSNIMGMVVGLVFGAFALKFFAIAPIYRARIYMLIIGLGYCLYWVTTFNHRFNYYYRKIEK